MDFIETLILAFCGKMAAKSALKETEKQTLYNPKEVNYENERAYLEKIDVKITEKYVRLAGEDFIYPLSADKARFKKEFESMVEWEKPGVMTMYQNTNGSTSSLNMRLKMIERLLRIEAEGTGETQELVHNELLYIINNTHPMTETELMIKKVCCFIDADYYFLRGDFECALKRLYDTLKWDKILNNLWLTDIGDGNGLENLYQAVVANIINIYALIGLPEKADETRSVFQTLYRQAKEMHRGVLQTAMTNISGSDDTYMEYLQKNGEAFDAAFDFIGYFSIRDECSTENMFGRFVLGMFGGEQKYNIFPSFNSKNYRYVYTQDDGKNVPVLKVDTLGIIYDVNKKAEGAKVKVKRLTTF